MVLVGVGTSKSQCHEAIRVCRLPRALLAARVRAGQPAVTDILLFETQKAERVDYFFGIVYK
jgi:hypothetical protein